MTINSPAELIQAINSLLLQMDRKGRKQFYMWVKAKRKVYDFNYPEGYKLKEEVNGQVSNAVEPVIVVPTAPSILVPESSVALPSDTAAGSADNSAVKTV